MTYVPRSGGPKGACDTRKEGVIALNRPVPSVRQSGDFGGVSGDPREGYRWWCSLERGRASPEWRCRMLKAKALENLNMVCLEDLTRDTFRTDSPQYICYSSGSDVDVPLFVGSSTRPLPPPF